MRVIGLMSGTSADGVDAALCEFQGAPGDLSATFIRGITVDYDPIARSRILRACDPDQSRVADIALLNVDLAEIFADCVQRLLDECGLSPSDIDLIGSHGQTIWHHVDAAGHVRASLQIVEPAVLAQRSGITTVSNFRARDIAAGGQGAPLTSYVDWLLLRHASHWRAIQNIGGMGNVTFLPPLNDKTSQPVAFDTGPGNALLDATVTHFTGGAQTFDRDGALAAQGRVDEDWLETLLSHPYYARDYPKTTGRETFGTGAALALIAEAQRKGLSPAEIVATLTALTAGNIADAYTRFAPAPIREVILGGGGRRNPAMVAMLRQLLSPARVMSHEDIGWNSDFKEALVFALLAYETWHGRPGSLPVFTGASQPSILGAITPGDNYARLLRQTWT